MNDSEGEEIFVDGVEVADSDTHNYTSDEVTGIDENGGYSPTEVSITSHEGEKFVDGGKSNDDLLERMGDINLSKEIQENQDDSATKEDSSPTKVNGERILIERDGKFELVDAGAVKAEFFGMLGLNVNDTNGEAGSAIKDEKPSKQEVSNEDDDKGSSKQRPHTSPVRRHNLQKSKNILPEGNRSQSAAVRRRPNPEYSHIKSKYGMTDQQLEMKKKREEALLRRKKEEEQRIKEENERRKQDAERAFQAWLHAKNTESLEKKKEMLKSQQKDDGHDKEEEANKAYQMWLEEKAKQIKKERYVEKCRLEEEASSYVIRDRNLCEAAFQSWLKKKRAETPKKAKKGKKKKGRGREVVSTKPSSKRFSDYYGYKNTLSV